MSDDLNRLLHTWTPDLPSLPELRRGVWARLAADPHPPTAWVRWWLLLARPGTAATLILLAALTGLSVGQSTAKQALAREYVSLVNPYAHFR
jgi:hypothetical protein